MVSQVPSSVKWSGAKSENRLLESYLKSNKKKPRRCRRGLCSMVGDVQVAYLLLLSCRHKSIDNFRLDLGEFILEANKLPVS